ncbi:peptide ABC transporter substrate-binding protein [Psittacicella hinzii]|nr:peptide ABC transporter substrate-binding protein [Psittacicella hinzii]
MLTFTQTLTTLFNSKITRLSTVTLALGSLVVGSLNPAYAVVPAGTKLAAQQTLALAFPASPDTLDPNLLKFSADFKTLRPVFDTLTRLNNEGKYIPVGATSWDVSDDGLTWTFHLRKEAKWQDGKAVTAHDYVYSWRRLTDPKTAAPYGDYLAQANVKNAKEVYSGKLPVSALGVKALDDYTIQVQLTYPTAWLYQMFSSVMTAPVRKDLIAKYGELWTNPDHFVGNGPYKIGYYRVNDQMVYDKWNGYWDAKNVHLTQVRHDYVKDPVTAYYRYLSGEYLVSDVPAQYLDLINKERPKEVFHVPAGRTAYFSFNTQRIPDANVRKALSLLTDRSMITKQIIKSNVPTSAFASPYLDDLELVKQQPWFKQAQKTNVATAVELLKQAGYTPANPLRLTLTQPSTPENDKIYVALAGSWRQASGGLIDLKQEAVEATSYYDKYNRTDYDLIIASYGMDYTQASTFYNIFLSDSPINNRKFISKEYDNLVVTANRSTDKATRQKLYAQANQVLVDGYQAAPLWYVETLILKKPQLKGYYTGLGVTYYQDMYIVANGNEKK